MSRNTRSNTKSNSQRKAIKVEVIELDQDSKQQDIKSFHQDSDISSDYSSADNSSVEQDSDAFKHLAPPEDPKKQKKNLIGFKSFFFESRTRTSDGVKDSSEEKEKDNESEVQNFDNFSQESIEPPSPEFSDPELQEQFLMSLPRKKPKLMDEIEKQLNKPAEDFNIEGLNEKRVERKREAKKRDYLIQKKYKEYKEGKKKDTMSNQVFNGIEDFFM